MTPRLKSSTKWTPIPKELCTQIREVFEENYAQYTKNGQFFVEGRIFPAEMLFRVGYLENGRLRQANVEVSLDFDANKQNALELIHFIVDCAASMLQDLFDAELSMEDFPHSWKLFNIEKKSVYLQVSAVNTTLEAQADALLGENDPDLVKGEDEEELKSAAISMLGLDKNDLDKDDTEAEEEMTEIITKVKNKKNPVH